MPTATPIGPASTSPIGTPQQWYRLDPSLPTAPHGVVVVYGGGGLLYAFPAASDGYGEYTAELATGMDTVDVLAGLGYTLV